MRSSAPLFNDAFNFMIEIVDDTGKCLEVIAGAENVIAAKAAFEVLLEQHRNSACLVLRQRGRVLLKADGRLD